MRPTVKVLGKVSTYSWNDEKGFCFYTVKQRFDI
jgi:hypothetical protein